MCEEVARVAEPTTGAHGQINQALSSLARQALARGGGPLAKASHRRGARLPPQSSWRVRLVGAVSLLPRRGLNRGSYVEVEGSGQPECAETSCGQGLGAMGSAPARRTRLALGRSVGACCRRGLARHHRVAPPRALDRPPFAEILSRLGLAYRRAFGRGLIEAFFPHCHFAQPSSGFSARAAACHIGALPPWPSTFLAATFGGRPKARVSAPHFSGPTCAGASTPPCTRSDK